MKSYKTIMPLIVLFLTLMVASCGTSDKPAESDDATTNTEVNAEAETPADADPLSNKGVGPISSITLGELDQALVDQGKEIYDAKCTACHRLDMKFIGPSPVGVMERRSPEWIMNMILDPEGMVANDPDAKALLIEFNGAPMANQSLTEEDARAVLEYFRTL